MESIRDIAVDDDGYVYAIGTTSSDGLPTTPGAYQTVSGGWRDVFVCKFDPTLSSLLWCTYLGGSDDDSGSAIRIGGDGDLFLAGYTRSADFPLVPSGSWPGLNGYFDAFICRMSNDGSTLGISRLFGGSDSEYMYRMELDGIGQVYLVGSTKSTDLNATAGTAQPTDPGEGSDGYLACFSAMDLDLIYSMYIGGTGSDYIPGLAVDDEGSVYITGQTNSTDLPVTVGALQGSFGGGYYDAFAFKLAKDGSHYVYYTYLGGMYMDDVGGVTVDDDGHAYITGYTNSSDFPRPPGIRFLENGYYPADGDAFVCKLEPDGGAVEFTTMIGGTDELEAGNRIALDGNGYIYVCGVAWSRTFPTTPGAFQCIPGEASGHVFDGMAFVLSPDGSKVEYSTFIGGSDYDWAVALAVDGGGNMHIGGTTQSTDMPTTDGAYQETVGNGSQYAYLCRIPTDFVAPVADAGDDVIVERSAMVDLDGTGSSDDRAVRNWTWSFEYDGQPVELHGEVPRFHFAILGSYTVELVVADWAGNTASDTMTVQLFASEGPVAIAGPDVTIDQFEVVKFNGSGSHDNVGVVNWTWRFNYNGSQVDLHGSTAMHFFELAGTYMVVLTVLDTVGNYGKDDLIVKVRDITPPSVLEDLSDTLATTGDPYTARIRVHDNIGIVSVATWDDPWTAVDIDDHGNGVYELEFVIFEEIVGRFYLQVKLVDESGNEHDHIVNVPDVVDNDPPELRRDSTGSEAVKGNGLVFILDVKENVDAQNCKVEVEYRFDDGPWQSGSMERMGTGVLLQCTYYVETPRDAEKVTYVLKAVDAAGNENISSERVVSLVNALPEIKGLPTWKVVEGTDAEFDLAPYLSDDNDEDLSVECSDGDILVEGHVLKVRHDIHLPDYSVTLTVSDGEDTTEAQLSIHVVNVNDAPVIIDRLPPTDTEFREDRKVTLSINTSDEDGDELTVTWWDGDAELGTGSFLEVKLKPGEHVITVVVTDGTDQVDDTFTVVVKKKEESPGFGPFIVFGAVLLACLISRKRQ
jgi:PKD repeat protein